MLKLATSKRDWAFSLSTPLKGESMGSLEGKYEEVGLSCDGCSG